MPRWSAAIEPYATKICAIAHNRDNERANVFMLYLELGMRLVDTDVFLFAHRGSRWNAFSHSIRVSAFLLLARS